MPTQLNQRPNANAIRILAMDAVQQANSGHPGAPMGMADIAEVLWREFLNHNPKNAKWPNRDRFVLSNGHGSMLIYALLHLTGYDLSIDDIKAFRQLHSKTAGHPEHGYADGIETTTGPLGQGKPDRHVPDRGGIRTTAAFYCICKVSENRLPCRCNSHYRLKRSVHILLHKRS